MASIREVAKLAHVAPSTVSRALNGSGYVSEKSKNKIKKAVEELDYIPNQWIRNLYKKKNTYKNFTHIIVGSPFEKELLKK